MFDVQHIESSKYNSNYSSEHESRGWWQRAEQVIARWRVQRQSARHSQRRREDRLATLDYVSLADGQVLAVPRANLAAAKELLAAEKAAERRVAEQRDIAMPAHLR